MTGPTERCWFFGTLAVKLARVDFLDPALAGSPGARERGVRVEIRPWAEDSHGSVYASPALSLGPAVCRIDLLESAPGAADRMHWHPVMVKGEPGDRVFEPAMPADPTAWLSDRLQEVDVLLKRSGMPGGDRHQGAVASIRASAKEIVDAARDGLAWASNRGQTSATTHEEWLSASPDPSFFASEREHHRRPPPSGAVTPTRGWTQPPTKAWTRSLDGSDTPPPEGDSRRPHSPTICACGCVTSTDRSHPGSARYD